MIDDRRNNARIGCFSHIAVYDVEVVDEERGISRGKIIADDTSKSKDGTIIFFSSLYSKDNDMDKMLHQYEIVDEKLMGVPFTLVPKEKMLFIYEEHTIIARPPRKIARRMGPY